MLRHEFQANDTLLDVRAYVDKRRSDTAHPDAKLPYMLIQAFPNRRFTTAEEAMGLSELGLCPGVNVIIKPMHVNVAESYPAQEGILQRGLGSLSWAVGSLWGSSSTDGK
jgi:hypothetical protein